MSLIVQRVPRTWQPQAPVPLTIDRPNSGIIYQAALDRDVLSNTLTTQNNLSNRQSSSLGLAVRGAGDISKSLRYATPAASGDFTLFSEFLVTANSSALVGVFSNGVGPANAHSLIVDSSGQISILSSTSDNWVICSGPIVTFGKKYRAVAVIVNGTRRLFIDGSFVGFEATARNCTSLTQAILGLYVSASSGSSPLAGDISLGGVLPYAISDTTALRWSNNPWQLFASISRQIWAPAAAGAPAFIPRQPYQINQSVKTAGYW